MYKLFLIARYLRKRLIALFAVVSVWLCVFMVIVVISVMGGFVNMVKQHSRGLLSDLIVDNQSLQGFPYYEPFIDMLLARLPDTVEAATPVIYNYGILRITQTNYTKPIQVVGIRLDQYRQINAFGESLFYNRYYPGTTTLAEQAQPVGGFGPNFLPVLPPEFEQAWNTYRSEHPDDPDLPRYARAPYASLPGPGRIETEIFGPPGYAGAEMPGVIIGVDLICDRDEQTGDYKDSLSLGSEVVVTVLPLTRKGTITGEGAVPMAMRYADRSRTKVYDIDKMCVYADFDRLQKALLMEEGRQTDGTVIPARASQVLVKLKEGQNIWKAKEAVVALWREFSNTLDVPFDSSEWQLLLGVGVETWEERQREYIQAVEKEKGLVVILFGIISLVAVVLIGCIFYMIVSHKTRDIGIVKSLGASSPGVATIFIGFGLGVGVIGSLLGTVSAVIFVHYINEIQDFLAELNPALRVWSRTVYVFDRIPNAVDAKEVAFIVAAALLASVLGALIPAILAARVWPVEALRYE